MVIRQAMFLKTSKKKQIDLPMCKYGLGCSRKDCVFRHPTKSPAVVAANEEEESLNENEVCMPFLADMCAFGETCFYYHPSTSECEKLRKKLASKWCRFGASCKTKGCLFKHVADSPIQVTTPKRESAPTILATGPVYKSPSTIASPSVDSVPIPTGIFISYDDAISTRAFDIKDPIER